MKLMFTGAAPWCNSGYGKPFRYLLPRLHAAGHELALCAFYGFDGTITDTEVNGAPLRIYPSARDSYFNDIIDRHAASFGADVVITLQDVWILQNWGHKDFPWLPWLPIDTHPVSPAILQSIEGCHTPLVWVDWAKRELQRNGWLQARTIPFGVDLDLHAPTDQNEARRAVGLPDDGRFIAGMVAANSSYPSRKSFPEVLLAWTEYLNRGGQGLLYLHTSVTMKGKAGVDLMGMLQSLSLPWSTVDDPDQKRHDLAKVMFPSQYEMWSGTFNDTKLAQLYNGLDLLLAPSMAEGFGIPIVEAQACGTPVVTLNNTAMTELTWNGYCLNPAQMAWEAEGGWRGVAPVAGLLAAIEGAEHGEVERRVPEEIASFGWDAVMGSAWHPLLEDLEAELC